MSVFQCRPPSAGSDYREITEALFCIL